MDESPRSTQPFYEGERNGVRKEDLLLLNHRKWSVFISYSIMYYVHYIYKVFTDGEFTSRLWSKIRVESYARYSDNKEKFVPKRYRCVVFFEVIRSSLWGMTPNREQVISRRWQVHGSFTGSTIRVLDLFFHDSSLFSLEHQSFSRSEVNDCRWSLEERPSRRVRD